jgi:predicted TIM-barrel fold metal-dependent hydrolase
MPTGFAVAAGSDMTLRIPGSEDVRSDLAHDAVASAEIESLLKDYSTVSFDMSIFNSVATTEAHDAELKRVIDAGFADRIMFGSDTRPAGPILRRFEKIDWLTAPQRRAILYDNAARFLRLDAQTIARHHGR